MPRRLNAGGADGLLLWNRLHRVSLRLLIMEPIADRRVLSGLSIWALPEVKAHRAGSSRTHHWALQGAVTQQGQQQASLRRFLLIIRRDDQSIIWLRLLKLQCPLERAVQPHIDVLGGHQHDRHRLLVDRLDCAVGLRREDRE
jgi:hypothetical protein